MRRFLLLRDAPTTSENPQTYSARLEELAGILAGIPWLLAGGLTIPLRLGAFYRRHSDIDVAFPVESFAAVDRAMRQAGFYLSTHFPMSVHGRLRFAVSVPLSHDGWLARRRPRKLKYRDATGTRQTPHLLSVIEVLPFRVMDGCFATCDGRYRMPLVQPLTGHSVRIGSSDISCLNLQYVLAIKRAIGGTKHALDLSMVAHQFPGNVEPERD